MIYNIIFHGSLIFISDCSGAYSLTSEWGTGQSGLFSFKVPSATSERNVKVVFDKRVKGIKVSGGKNEKCEGKICTFTHRIRQPLKKGQKLEMVHRIGFDLPGAAQVTEIEFNGEEICSK